MQRKTTIENAFKRKYPEPVVLVTTRAPGGRANVMAVGWVMIASSEPWMFALGIDDGAYTYELIRKTREFVVAFPSEEMTKETRYAGTHHGHTQDKFAATGLKTQPATAVQAPLIADAVANFECRLSKIVRPGDCPVIFGEIVAAHENRDRRRRRLFNWGRNYTLAGAQKR
jgi:flavin reductase (DIM6/NTAB) family NADH-FMN oxidoreductase RutF